MAITKETVIDKREILRDGTIQVRESVEVFEDGNLISKSFHRYVINPGDDVSTKDPAIKRIAQVEHTPERVQAFRDKHPDRGQNGA